MEETDGSLLLNGEIIFRNPFGHLPGAIVGFLPVLSVEFRDSCL